MTRRGGPSATDVAFDEDALRTRVAGDESLLAIVIETFVDDAPRKLAALRDAVAREERVQIARLARSLRGAAASAAATELLALTAELERSTESADRASLEEQLAALDAALERYAAAACL